MSMPAMRLAFDHPSASAVRSSIAAAMVIAEPVLYEIVYNFRLWPTFAGKCQQRVITIRSRRGGRGREGGRRFASGIRILRRGPGGGPRFLRPPWAVTRGAPAG